MRWNKHGCVEKLRAGSRYKMQGMHEMVSEEVKSV